MSVNSTYVSATLAAVIRIVPVCINFVTVVAGIVGGLCNIITYTSSQVRNNASVFYLLCATVFELLSILFIVPTRIALDNFQFNLERQSIIFCKIRYYISITAPMLVTYYILLATFDRCLVTSSNAAIRSWSQLKIAYRLSLAVLVVGVVGSVHIFIFYRIYHNNCQVPPGTIYTVLFSVYLIFIVSLLPHSLMLILVFITFRNLKRVRRRTVPVPNASNSSRIKRSETQLIMVVVIQVITSSTLVLLRLGSYSYSTLTSGNVNKSVDQLAAEDLAIRLGFALYYFSFATSFYLSILSRKFFRDIFYKRVRELFRRCQRFTV